MARELVARSQEELEDIFDLLIEVDHAPFHADGLRLSDAGQLIVPFDFVEGQEEADARFWYDRYRTKSIYDTWAAYLKIENILSYEVKGEGEGYLQSLDFKEGKVIVRGCFQSVEATVSDVCVRLDISDQYLGETAVYSWHGIYWTVFAGKPKKSPFFTGVMKRIDEAEQKARTTPAEGGEC